VHYCFVFFKKKKKRKKERKKKKKLKLGLSVNQPKTGSRPSHTICEDLYAYSKNKIFSSSIIRFSVCQSSSSHCFQSL